MDSSQTPQQYHAFTSGFSLGVLFGAAGYFFFATDQGTRLRHKLLKEWEEIRSEVAEGGQMNHSTMSFRGFWQNFLREVGEFAEPIQGEVVDTSSQTAPKRLGRPPGSGKAKKAGDRFKNV